MTWFERATLPALPLITVALLLLSACGRPPDEGFALRPMVGEKAYVVAADPAGEVPAGLSFPRDPELRELTFDHERRPVVLTTAGTWRWRGRIPKKGAHLHAGVQILPAAWKSVESVDVQLVVRDAREGRERELLDNGRLDRESASRWLGLEASLGRWVGREVIVEATVTLDGLPEEHRASNLVAWGPASLSTPPDPKTDGRPNVLFILVDTLRHDHLTPYGYRRDTSPEIQRWLAQPGAVVEEAYSQAPWTLPSVISLMTGRYPGKLVGSDLTSFGIPAEVETLAERMSKLGYQTAGFVANPTVHAGAGFARGFQTYFVPPADVHFITLHGDLINAHALPWLRASQSRPFFAYVHYIDPHDPYYNPDMNAHGGRSPFMPDYTGPVVGDWIHGIYTGHIPIDPDRDLPHIRALYDSEIRYVDRRIGELLASLHPDVLANTLIVLTSDHGEELFDHGGWKHGQTLYEEQIHVPLIVRWDGRIPPGTRVRGTVRLLDLVPTLAAAVGAESSPDWDGVDLLPALTGVGTLPRRPAFAQHLTVGPTRAAAVLDRRKLILYNDREPFVPADDLQAHLFEIDRARLQREELYDLSRDPGERRNTVRENPGTVAALEPVIHSQLEEHLPGLWVLTDSLPPGSRLGGTITFERAPQRWVPYFLGAGDRLEAEGSRVVFDIAAETLVKGFRIEGDPGRIAGVTLTLDGQPVPPGRVLVGPGTPYGGGPVAPAALRSPEWPLASPAPVPGFLRIWVRQGETVKRRPPDPETEKRLRALGYIQ